MFAFFEFKFSDLSFLNRNLGISFFLKAISVEI